MKLNGYLSSVGYSFHGGNSSFEVYPYTTWNTNNDSLLVVDLAGAKLKYIFLGDSGYAGYIRHYPRN